MSLGQILLRGAVTVYGSLLAGKLLTLLSTILLARLLVPGDFGLVAYALLVLSFLDTLKTVGLGSALIYRQDDTQSVASETFFLGLIAAGVCYAACWALAPLGADFFHAEQITVVIRLLGLTLLIDALGEVHATLLEKDMRFGRRHIPRLAQHLSKGLVSVGLALAGFGFWSLVWGQLVGSAVALVLSWTVHPWRPRLGLRWLSARASLAYGARATLIRLLAGVAINAASVVVGRMLGNEALGLYDLAMTLPMIVVMYAARAISQVAFPALARLQQDPESLKRGYLQTLRYTALIVLPVGLGLALVTPSFVRTVYTPVWWPMIPVMQALAVFATVDALAWTTGDVCMATARLGAYCGLVLAYVITLVPALTIGGALGGIVGVSLAQIAAVVPFRLATLYLANRLVRAEFSALRMAFQQSGIAGLVMVATCVVCAELSAGLAAPWTLMLQVVLGAVVYVGMVWLIAPDIRADAIHAVWRLGSAGGRYALVRGVTPRGQAG